MRFVRPGAGRGERGFALLLVLWSLVLLTLITTRLIAGGRDEVKLASNLRSAAEAEMLADAGVQEAAFRLFGQLGSGRAVGGEQALTLPGGLVRVRIVDQSGLINPNQAQAGLLTALLRAAGADTGTARTVAAGIMEWRSEGVQTRTAEAKAAEYRAAGLDYAPPSAPFQSVDEVGLVLGMTPELFDRLAPHLSVYYVGEPNPAAADPVVLEAIRQASGQAAATATKQAASLVVAITADAEGRGGGRFVREAVVRLGGSGPLYTVLDWRRGKG